MSIRNNPAKAGKKPAPKPLVERKADQVKLREQWQDAYDDYLWWKARAVKCRRSTSRGAKVLSVEYKGWESARKHLLAVSRALADVLGLDPESNEQDGVVLRMLKGKKGEAGE